MCHGDCWCFVKTTLISFGRYAWRLGKFSYSMETCARSKKCTTIASICMRIFRKKLFAREYDRNHSLGWLQTSCSTITQSPTMAIVDGARTLGNSSPEEDGSIVCLKVYSSTDITRRQTQHDDTFSSFTDVFGVGVPLIFALTEMDCSQSHIRRIL